MKKNNYLPLMLKFAREAGDLSKRLFKDCSPTIKPDRSVLTKSDHAIAALARKMLKEHLKDPQHLLIDEEDPQVNEYLNQDLLNKKKFVWAIDPIDGTRLYANGVPLYAISIGLIKERKPFLGVVYFPLQNELFYNDGKISYFVQNAFTSKAKKIKIPMHKKDVGSLSLFFCDDDIFRHYNWDYKDCQVIVSASATIDLCWCTIGRGCGAFFRANFWDFAGAWPIFGNVGLKLRAFSSGEALTHLDTKFFNTARNSWKVNDFYILSTENNFSILKNKMIPKEK